MTGGATRFPQTTKMSAELVEMAIELEEMSKANHTSSADALLLREQLAHQTDQVRTSKTSWS